MKIAFIIQFNEPQLGGLFISATNRIKYFSQINKDIEVVVYNFKSKPSQIIRALKSLFRKQNNYDQKSVFNELTVFNIYYSSSFKEYFINRFIKQQKKYYLKAANQLSKYFNDVDLIAAHYGNGPGEFAMHLSELLKINYSVTFHGSDIHTSPFINNHNYVLYKNILEKSSANIFVSKALMKKALQISNTTDKNFCLYDGVDFSKFNTTELSDKSELKLRYKIKNKVVGFIGNLVDVKNIFALVLIFETIMKQNIDVSFIIIGDGVLKNKLQIALKRKSIPVIFLNKISNSSMPAYYKIIDVLVLPSKNEGLPRVIIEALACGVSCVGSDVGGIPELLPKENVFKLNQDFTTLISKRIIELLEAKEEIIFNQKKFDLENIALEQGILFRKLMTNNSSFASQNVC